MKADIQRFLRGWPEGKELNWAGGGDSDWPNNFVGRDLELERIRSMLRRASRFPVFLIGPRGVGKTALCYAYISRFSANYRRCVRVSCSRSIEINSLAAILRSELGLPLGRGSAASDAEALIHYLGASRTEKPVLFVLDDIDQLSERDFTNALRFFAPVLEFSRAIFSGTALPPAQDHDKLAQNTLVLSPLNQRDAEELLFHRVKMAGLEKKVAITFLRELSKFGVDWAAVSPRFILRLFESYIRDGRIDTAFLESVRYYFPAVTNFVVSDTDDGLKVLPVGFLDPTQIITPNSGVFGASPLVVIPNFKSFWRRRLDEFEELLNNPRTTEPQIQNFLERHPQFLKGIDYEHTIAHPVLERDDDGDLIPDFFLKPRNSELIDILDLKLPTKKLIVGKPDRKKLSGPVTDAIAQVREYRDYFERPEYRARVLKKYGVRGYRPNTIVVIGRDPKEVPEDKVRQVFSDLPNFVRIMTFDDIYGRMKTMANCNLL